MKQTRGLAETDRSIMALGTATAAEIKIEEDASAALEALLKRSALDLVDILGLTPHVKGANYGRN